MDQNKILGIDVGGTGVKGAIVDITTGEMLTERRKVPTPKPADPAALAKCFKQMVDEFKWEGHVGCGFPTVIDNGTALTASNISNDWIGTNVEDVFSNAIGRKVYVANDADVAGLAEVKFGGGADHKGAIVFITIGTGLGSALFYNGQLFPNTEFGHVFLVGGILAEKYASEKVRKVNELSWEEWGTRFNTYLLEIEKLLRPNLIILGGGGAKRMDNFKKYFTLDTNVVQAKLGNHAGIIGAAMYAKTKIPLTESSKVF